MLLADIVIMREGSTQVLSIQRGKHSFQQAWRYESDDHWDDRTLALAALEIGDPYKQPEVFVCLRMDEPRDLLDRDYVGTLIRKVRAHTWGSNLYVVLDSQLKIERVTDNPMSLVAFLKETYQAGATDIIQVALPQLYEDETPVFDSSAMLKGLFDGAEVSRPRQSKLRPGKRWDCLLRNKRQDNNLNWLLGESFAVHWREEVLGKKLHDEQGLVTIVERETTQNELVNVARSACPQRSHLAALRKPMNVLNDAKVLLAQKQLEVVHYYGPLELWFLLHLLNTNELPDATKVSTGKVTPATRDPKLVPLFKPTPKEKKGRLPSLLVTSSFDLSHEAERHFVLSAASEVGQVTRRKPAHTRYIVHPAANCENLPPLIKQLETKHLTAWLHIGHGKRKNGLWEACGSVQSAKHWLHCFHRHRSDQGSLALAVFSACESLEVARLFASAGVGLAVGFRDEIETNICELFTAGLITAALRTNGDPKAILDAYHAGRADLISTYGKDFGLAAFSAEGGKQ